MKQDELNIKSKTQLFIDDMLEHPNGWDGRLLKISKNDFKEQITRYKATAIPFYKLDTYLHESEIKPHPMLKVYKTIDYETNYPNGGSDYGFAFVFYYKGQYYEYSEFGGA